MVGTSSIRDRLLEEGRAFKDISVFKETPIIEVFCNDMSEKYYSKEHLVIKMESETILVELYDMILNTMIDVELYPKDIFNKLVTRDRFLSFDRAAKAKMLNRYMEVSTKLSEARVGTLSYDNGYSSYFRMFPFVFSRVYYDLSYTSRMAFIIRIHLPSDPRYLLKKKMRNTLHNNEGTNNIFDDKDKFFEYCIEKIKKVKESIECDQQN